MKPAGGPGNASVPDDVGRSDCDSTTLGAQTAAAAGVVAVPYDGRHTYASLLIGEGRTPVLVAQQTGHSLHELWRSYAHRFEGADELARAAMDVAIAAARTTVADRAVHNSCTTPLAGDAESESSLSENAYGE